MIHHFTKRRLSYFLVVFAFLMLNACTSNHSSTIDVRGEATVKAPVDYMSMDISIIERAPQLQEAEQKGYESSKRVRDYLMNQLGLPDSLIQTKSSNIHQSYRQPDEETAFEFRQTYAVRLDSIQRFDSIRKTLIRSGASEVNLSGFGSTRISEFRKKAYQRAYQAAYNHAHLLAKESGLELQKPININSSYHQGPPIPREARGLNMASSTNDRSPTLIQTHIEIEAQLEVSFSAR